MQKSSKGIKRQNPFIRFARHMQFHSSEIGHYQAVRLAAALTYGECRDRILPKWKNDRQARINFDKRYNVHTAERFHVSEMNVAEDGKRYAIRYEPIYSQHVVDAFAALDIDFTKYTFIDIGAGKGKVLFIAASYAFKRIIGVEFDTQLAKVADSNIRSYQNPDCLCDTLEIVNLDARKFQLPSGPIILFFYFPFRAPLLSQVLDNFSNSLDDCYFIWVTLEEAEEAVIKKCSELTFMTKGEEFSIFKGQNIR